MYSCIIYYTNFLGQNACSRSTYFFLFPLCWFAPLNSLCGLDGDPTIPRLKTLKRLKPNHVVPSSLCSSNSGKADRRTGDWLFRVSQLDSPTGRPVQFRAKKSAQTAGPIILAFTQKSQRAAILTQIPAFAQRTLWVGGEQASPSLSQLFLSQSIS